MTILGLIVLVLLLLLLRQPVMIILMAVLAYCYYFFSDSELRFILLDAWGALNKEVLLSIPLYILAGNLMSAGSMASRITDVLREVTIIIPGGLALSAVLACAIFAAMSGSSTVTLLAVGSVLYPALIEAGYPKRLSIGVLCAAGTLGIIIPPSIPLILYGVMTKASIVDLFLAGFGPALLLTFIISAYVLFKCRHMPTGRYSVALWHSLKRSILALLAPALVLGGIYSGFFTATEAAVVAVFYTLFIQLFVYKEMQINDVLKITEKTCTLIGGLFPVLMLAVCLNMFLTYQQLPDQLVATMLQYIDSKLSFLLASNILLLLTGSIIDIGSAILILAPLLKPVANSLGIDTIHFGIMMIVNLEIGYLTPPMGLNLIIAMGAFRESFWEICKAAVPFMGLMLIGLIIVAAVPEISLFLL
ncbi:TRAP transporter large permease [Oceanicoccus sp. KOV_DT_Chl]|uniref:TRAP transporter large permease n=1 Tax=Oceanicoccus sp. KOV_DT_Chl TaxID=1904639 RepID=UPI000C7D324F|nr:TRAP transporter large permease [Oceanicoccus sp. KOV_DT_Chl]